MAKTTKGRSTVRRQKQSRTIDLKANPVSPDDEAEADAKKQADEVTAKMAEEEKVETAKNTEAKKNDQAASDEAAKGAEPDQPAGDMPAPAKSGGGFGSMLLSAILGGGIALGGASVLGGSNMLANVPVIGGLLSSSEDGSNAALEVANQKIADLTAKVEALSSAGGDDAVAQIAGLSDKLAQLETRLGEASNGGGAGDELAREALAAAQAARQQAEQTATQLSVLNDKILENAGGEGVDMEAVKAALSQEVKSEADAVASRIDALETAVNAGQGGGASSETMQAVQQELESLKSGVAGIAGVSAAIEAVQKDASGLGDQLTKTDEAVSALGGRLGTLESAVNEKILPAMQQVESAATAAIESQRVARSVSARALGTVLEQGGKFTSELAAAEALVGDTEAIKGLKSLAESGILTEAELLTQFDTLATSIAEQEAGEAAGDGILDKFMASAKSLVKVRPAGPVEGDSTVAILSRVEDKLKSRDLENAQSEWNALDEAAKTRSSDWAAALSDRITAKGLIETVIGELSTPAGGKE